MRGVREMNKAWESDEAIQMLQLLLNLTEKEKIHWDCFEYAPIEPISPYPVENEAEHLFFFHSFKSRAAFRTMEYSLDVIEGVILPEEEGQIDLTVFGNPLQGENLESMIAPFSFSLFPNDLKKSFLSPVLAQIQSQHIVADRFQKARFDDMRGNILFRDHPDYQRIKGLFTDRDLLSFHQFVSDKLR